MRSGLLIAVALAVASPAASETKWTMVRTPTLMVIGDQSASTLRTVGVEMEQFRMVVGGLFPKAEQPLVLPTAVFVFGDRRSAQPFMPLGPAGKPAQVAGYFSRGQDMHSILMALEGFDEAGPLIYHEYTHLLIGGAVRSVPVWLNEGLAEYYSTYLLTNGGKAAEVGRPIGRHIQLLREKYMPLAELIPVDRTSDLYNEGQRRSIFYAESWALVHYLMAEMKGGPAAINRYAASIAGGVKPHDAFRDAFGSTPKEFDNQLRAYVRRMVFAGQRYTFDERVVAPPVTDPRSISHGEANAWLGDLQRRIGRGDEGAKRVEAALQTDPSSPASHLALGLLRIDQEREAEGLDALNRAAELGRDEFVMPFVYGVSLLRTGYRDSLGAASAAIPPLKRATELKPDSADAFGWLAYAQMQHAATVADARASIERAAALAPGNATIQIRRADIIGLQGRYEEARKALEAIAASPDPLESDAASASLESMERRQRRDQAEAADVAAAAASDHAGRPGSERRVDDEQRAMPALRKLKPGELRAWGLLVRISCSASEVRFEVRGGSRTVVATAPRMEDVALVSYLDDKDFTIACGPRGRPDSVYVTWTPGDGSNGRGEGIAVAVEFLPKGYTP